MQIMVYWAEDGEMNGAVDCFTPPYNEEWSRWRISFMRLENNHVLGVSKLSDMGEELPNHAGVQLLFCVHKALDWESYLSWLEDNVDAIQIDGFPVWQSKRVE